MPDPSDRSDRPARAQNELPAPLRLALIADQPNWAYARIARGIAPWLDRAGFSCSIGYACGPLLEQARALARESDAVLSFGFPIFTKHGVFREQADRLLLGLWDSAYVEDRATCEGLARARATLCFNRAIHAAALAAGLTNTVLVSPPVGVDPDLFAPAPAMEPASAPPPPRALRLGFVGNLNRANKRLDLVVALMKAVPPAVEFLLIDPPGRKNQRVVADPDLVRYYRSLDVLLSVSDYEGGPLPPIEAAACGVPCLCTPVGILPEFVRHEGNGLLVNGNLHELRSAVARLLHEQGLLARMKSAARPRALEWRWEEVAQAYAAAIRAATSA
ncbi:MAG: glycosyltransferase family 4 protein [Kiritimatiellae bacterium]|nr:glycosyltransferase family 4 protein [Kiritimatiellia bacterium]